MHGDFVLNKNHLDIVFGASIAVTSITSLVIKQQEIDYLLPLKTDFECVASFQSANDWDSFVSTYREKGEARVVVTAQIISESKVVSKFQGVFVLYK